MDLIERSGGVTRRHPWEIARATFFLRLVERLGTLATTDSWLDVGAGDAWFAQQLRAVLPPAARLACWDVHYPADGPEVATGTTGIEFSAQRPGGVFGGVLMLDVVEHVEDDTAFVREVVDGSLAPGGWVLVSVPAYQGLFSEHDRALKHFRRYSPDAIRTVLESAGLAVQARGGLFHGLLPARAAQVLRERLRPPHPTSTGRVSPDGREPSTGIGDWRGGPRLTTALTAVLGADTRVSLALATRRLAPLPGLSTWAFCRRREPGPR
ncbi:MAG TPA: methyltransferase domain-containing protein [Acidimicrobiales bacterium]|nr:methyltransferase domain-containing protein [Acidimicrobiales bacterium]